MESPIGSFLLKDCGEDHHDDRPLPPSLWRQIVASRYGDHHRRLLLQGPHLMTTSLLFDHAIYLASIEPCRCRYSNFRENSDELNCHCVAVTILRSTARRDDAFPIRCRPQPERIDLTGKSDDVKHESDPWPTPAFRRIQIIYVKDMSDILQYLFTIASQPLHQQPWGGILIDQLDAIVIPPYQECHVTATTIMSQTVAILVDTVSFLEKAHGCGPTLMVTIQHDDDDHRDTCSSKFIASANHLFQRSSSFWSPLHLTLVPAVMKHTPDDKNHDDDTEVVQSVYHLTAPDTTILAVLTTYRNFENETQIGWTSAIDEPSDAIHA